MIWAGIFTPLQSALYKPRPGAPLELMPPVPRALRVDACCA
jgi:hypothetical protein